MHGDGAFNCHIRVLLGRVEAFELSVETVELHLDLRACRQLLLLGSCTCNLHVSSLHVELSRDLVLVALNKVGDHSPNHMKFLALRRRHRLAKIL